MKRKYENVEVEREVKTRTAVCALFCVCLGTKIGYILRELMYGSGKLSPQARIIFPVTCTVVFVLLHRCDGERLRWSECCYQTCVVWNVTGSSPPLQSFNPLFINSTIYLTLYKLPLSCRASMSSMIDQHTE